MPLNKVAIGQPLKEFPGGTFNSLVSVAQQYRRERANFGGGLAREILPDAFKWKNASGADAPRGALIRFTGAVTVRNQVVLTGDKPNSEVQQFYGVALEAARDGKIGRCTAWNAARLHYLDSDGTPAFGEIWGPADGQWYAKKNRFGFFVLGDPNGTGGDAQTLAQQSANSRVLCQADADIEAGDSGTLSIYGGTPGAETDTTFNVTAYNYFRYINSGDWVWCAHNGYGWYVVAKDSPPGLLGKTDAAHNKGANGTVSIYAGTPGSETDTTADVTAHNKFANIASGKWVWVAPFDSNWYITAAEC